MQRTGDKGADAVDDTQLRESERASERERERERERVSEIDRERERERDCTERQHAESRRGNRQ